VEEKKLKLFVVGESSTDPKKWGANRRAFVIAESPEAAEKMSPYTNGSIVEITMTEPMIVGSEDDTWDD
jgi:hypothetical protein